MILYVDDVLTRRYWAEQMGDGRLRCNPFNYKEVQPRQEIEAFESLHNFNFIPFIPGYVLDMTLGRNSEYGYGGSSPRYLLNALQWFVNKNILMGAHGYYHTRIDVERDKFRGWAKKCYSALETLQPRQKHYWHSPFNRYFDSGTIEYLERLGFQVIVTTSEDTVLHVYNLVRNPREVLKDLKEGRRRVI